MDPLLNNGRAANKATELIYCLRKHFKVIPQDTA